MSIEKYIDDIFDELVNIRRNFHMYPELSENELETCKKISNYLAKENIEHIYNNKYNNVCAIIRGKSNGRTVAARADIDALPIIEKSTQGYISTKKGIMHACGHDVHMTILLGTAYIIKKLEHKLVGNVKFFFQPAEETVGGAEQMIKQGCLDNPSVEYIIGLHVQPYIEAGKIELKYGKFYAATDEIIIKINGKSGHGAAPETSVDAIVIAASIITALQSIVSRNISPLNSVVLSLCTINGGTKNNIIADNVEIKGILRTLDEATRFYVKQKINQIVQNICIAYEGQGLVEINNGYKYLINNNDVVDVIQDTAKKIIGSDNIIIRDKPIMCGEDFSYFLERAKGAYYHLGCRSINKGIISPLHSNEFDVDEECIRLGVRLQVETLLKLLNY